MPKTLLFLIAVIGCLCTSPTYAQDAEALPSSEPADEGPCRLKALNGGIGCVHEGGDAAWEIRHPSLWEDAEDFVAQVEERRPVGPVEIGGRTFYAVRGDLLEVDVDAAKIVGRRRMPAPIVSLGRADGSEEHLEVVIRHVGDMPGVVENLITLTYGLDAPVPSQDVWFGRTNLSGRLTARRDADWLVSSLAEADDEVVLERLLEAWERDPLNLFYLAHLTNSRYAALYLGRLGVDLDSGVADEGGEAQIAKFQRLWSEATEGPFTGPTGPPWQDMINVSWVLEGDELGRGFGDRPYNAGHKAMIEAGMLPERMGNLVGFVMRNMGSMDAVKGAVEAGDAERVAALSERLAVGAPLVEGGEYVWPDLARWLEAKGHPATIWHERAKDNAERSFSFSGGNARTVDRLLVVMGGISLALLLYALVIGVQGGRARRRRRDEEPTGNHPLWRPVLRVRDIVGLMILVLALPLCNHFIATDIFTIGALAAAPLGIFDDTLAAPDVQVWLEGLAESPARDELLEIARAEHEALKEGRVVENKAAVGHLFHAAATADGRAIQWRMLREGRFSNPSALAGITDTDVLAEEHTFSLLTFFPFFAFLAMLIMMGSLLGGYLPVVGTWIVRIVPGAAPALAPVGGLLLAGCIAAILAFMGLDSILSSLARPAFGKYFGLEAIAGSELLTPDRGWAVVALVGAVALQAIAVFFGERRGRDQTPGS
ncbi:MAG: hypothetical protein ACNA8W_06075 [Bradymonadaceae bacterium]